MRFVLTSLALFLATSAAAQEVDQAQVARIVDQGMNHGEVMETAAYLTDRIGGRMTNSPQMRAAERWTQQRFREWGLANVRAEPFAFGRGWSIARSSARMTAPRVLDLVAIPIAWTPATNGAISAGVVVAPISEERHFDAWRGKLAGRIVLVTHPGSGSADTADAPFQRLTDEALRKLDEYSQPTFSPIAVEKRLKQLEFNEKRDAFLKAEGALAWVRMSRLDGRLVHGEGSGYRVGRTPTLPGFELAAEDYRRLARLALTDAPPTLELVSDVRFHDEDVNAYNVIADIPGSDPRAGYVMAGAHLDSWVASDGAADNAAGSAVVMEAARILRMLGVRPRRTIRFALWSGEEQGLHGSLAYVERHLATRGPLDDPDQARLGAYATWRQRWPIEPRPRYGDLAAYFNIDNGSGKIRGIHAEGNAAAVPIFREWLAPFAGMGASTVAARPDRGTDHVFLQSIGLPGFQFIQDPLDYETRVHHTSIDSYDHLRAEDMRQASVILASFLLNAANRDQPLPRAPLPTRPRASDPFEYAKPD